MNSDFYANVQSTYEHLLFYFRMSYSDFLANFDEIQLCHLQPDAVAKDLADATVCIFLQAQHEKNVLSGYLIKPDTN